MCVFVSSAGRRHFLDGAGIAAAAGGLALTAGKLDGIAGGG